MHPDRAPRTPGTWTQACPRSYIRHPAAAAPGSTVTILSTHLPPATDRTPEFMERLSGAPATDPFIGPGRHALEEMLATFEPGAA